jgi:hypothetical protein
MLGGIGRSLGKSVGGFVKKITCAYLRDSSLSRLKDKDGFYLCVRTS